MKTILITLFLTINMLTSWGQIINSVQPTSNINLFANSQITASIIHQFIRQHNIEKLKILIANNSSTIIDQDYFWQQFDESGKYFPTCKFLDSVTTYTYDNKTIISYRYQFTSVNNADSFEYSVYFTFCYSDDNGKRLNILFVKAPNNIKRNTSEGVYDDYIYLSTNNIKQTDKRVYDDFIYTKPKK